MTSSARENKFAVAAAIGFLVVFSFSITTKLIAFLSAREILFTVERLLNWIVYLSLAATLFTKNKIAVLSAAGAAVLLSLYYLIDDPKNIFSYADFLSFSALAVLIVLSMMQKPFVSRLWFVPGALMAALATAGWAKNLIAWFSRNTRFPENLVRFFSVAGANIFFDLLMTAALFLAGLPE